MNHSCQIAVLIVEDDEVHRELIASHLDRDEVRFEIAFAESCSQAIEQLASRTFDCVILDHNLHDGTGDQILRIAHDDLITTPVVAISTSIDPDVMITEFKSGCVDFIAKRDAFRGRVLANAVTQVVKNNRTRAAVERAGASVTMIEKAGAILAFNGDDPDSGLSHQSIEKNLQLIYEVAVQTIQDGVVLIERRSRVVYANPAFKRLLGLSDESDLPGGPLATIDDVMTAGAAAHFRRFDPQQSQFESWLCSATGEPVPVLIGQTPVGEHCILCAVSDLRAIKRQQRELEEKNQRLAQLYETANRFVDDVSHEFRTPLTVIKGYTEILEQEITGPVTDEQRGFLWTILDRTRDLAQMVDDLLDTSKVRSGCFRVDRRPQRLGDIVASIRPSIVHKALTNHVNIHANISEHLPLVFADAEKIGRVLLNLIVNAVKFSPEGGDVVIRAKPGASGEVQVDVTDNGPGISKENLRNIFRRFQQVGDPQRSSTKGFGLGLSIASELMAMNLGTISVESEQNRGSTFSFTLPVNDPAVVARRLLTRAALTQNLDDAQSAVERSAIAMLLVTPAHGVKCSDQLRSHLASHTKTMDLIFEAADHRSMILFGFSSNPERWVERLRDAFDEADEHPGAVKMETPGFQILGSWSASGESTQAIDVLTKRIESSNNVESNPPPNEMSPVGGKGERALA